jgi:hypothetical protein
LDGAISVIVRRAASGARAATRFEDQVAVDFVGTDHQIVLLGQRQDLVQFVVAPGAADRIVRMAEQEQARVRRPQHAIDGGEVPDPAGFVAHQRRRHGAPRRILR